MTSRSKLRVGKSLVVLFTAAIAIPSAQAAIYVGDWDIVAKLINSVQSVTSSTGTRKP